MKTKKINARLTLNKETVVHLNGKELQGIKGGYDKTDPTVCISRNLCSEPAIICETRLFCSVHICETDPDICF